ncbi:MAG: hypothetical protein NTU83_07400 [Candidatus Hydrogenedentes bacterium]|nr:hypothetical protein [Candidatus Hydrogenedentota bacterium]
MANFASESDVRLAIQVSDTVAVPSTLVVASLAAAHDALLRRIDPALSMTPPPAAVVHGEAWLAGAAVLRSLAAKDTVEQKQLTIGNQRIEAGARYSALTAMAELAEAQAWEALEPYLTDCQGREPGGATDSNE